VRHRSRLAVGLIVVVGLTVPTAPTSGIATAPALRGTPASPGSPGSGDPLFPRAGNGGYDVRHYAISLRWRRDGTIVATTRITAVAQQALSAFNLDLKGLEVDAATVDGAHADFARHGRELTITPAGAVADGATFRATVRYHGEPRFLIDPDGSPDGWIPTPDGATAMSEPIGSMTWFPNNDTPRDKATYDIDVTAPAAKKVASNGRLVGRTTHANHTTTWHWRERDPMASYLASVSIGDYAMVLGTSRRGVPLRSFVERSAGAEDTARKVGTVVDYWSRKFGPYPFTSAGIIVDNVRVDYALEVQTRPVFPSDPGFGTLLAHELAHQWFGDSVSLRDWSDIWLNEGFATYAEWLWEARVDPGAPRRHLRNLYDDNGPRSTFWDGLVAHPADASELFNTRLVYVRAAMTLEALRLTIGPADFNTLVRRWAALLRHGNGTTARFEAMAANVSGQSLTRFFDEWLHQQGKPGEPPGL
jgi:aminopeptidase N